MLNRPKRNTEHFQSAFFDMESSICDRNGATKLFLEVFRSVFDRAPQEKRDGLHVYVIDPDTVTAMVFAANTM